MTTQIILHCSRCNEDKPESDFHKNRSSTARGGRARWCRPCWKSYSTSHGDRVNPATIILLLQAQNNVCAICSQPETSPGGRNGTSSKRMSVDRDANNNIRGLLCQRCNQALGHFDDSIERLQAAIAYLSKPPQVLRLPLFEAPLQ